MAKKSFKLQNKKLFLLVSVVLLVAIGVGLYFIYKQNLGATDSDAGIDKPLVLLSSSISKVNVNKNEKFTVKCNYLIPYSTLKTKYADGTAAAKETAKGIYVIGEGITCTKNALANASEPGNVSFTCKSEKDGIYSVGCGIKQGTQTFRLVEGRSTEVCQTTPKVEEKTYVGNNCDGYQSGACNCQFEIDKYKCYVTTTKEGEKSDCKKYVRNEAIPVTVDYLNSYKIIDNVKVGTPTGATNCVVPAYISSSLSKTTVDKSVIGTRFEYQYKYSATCTYAIKGTHSTSLVKVTADKATCAAVKSDTTEYKEYTLGNPDVMSAGCTPKSNLPVNTKITSKCNFVAGSVAGVSICGRTDTIKDVVTVVKN